MLANTSARTSGVKFKVSMKEILRYWRDLDTKAKKQIMQQRNIQKITFEQIKSIHLELKK